MGKLKRVSAALFLVLVSLMITRPSVVSAAIAQSPKVPGLSDKPIWEVINDAIIYISWILAGLFILMIIIGAIMMMTLSAAEQQEKGKETIKWAIIGAVVSMLSWTIFQIISRLVVG